MLLIGSSYIRKEGTADRALERYEHTAVVLERMTSCSASLTALPPVPDWIWRRTTSRRLFSCFGLCFDIRSAKTGPSAQMGAVRQLNSPRWDRLDSLAHLIKGFTSNLAHPAEGFCWSDRTAQVSLALSAEEVSFNEVCPSVSFAWKVEVLLEKALREVVDIYHPRSMTLVTHLEQACYQFAIEA